jgi:hypothetical protein
MRRFGGATSCAASSLAVAHAVAAERARAAPPRREARARVGPRAGAPPARILAARPPEYPRVPPSTGAANRSAASARPPARALDAEYPRVPLNTHSTAAADRSAASARPHGLFSRGVPVGARRRADMRRSRRRRMTGEPCARRLCAMTRTRTRSRRCGRAFWKRFLSGNGLNGERVSGKGASRNGLSGNG